MTRGRLEAFSDAVIAIAMTIMVLELKVPHGMDWESLRPLLPIFFSYVLSYTYLGIYWNNHHHMLHTCDTINGRILWANLHLLFWLSLIPVATAWLGDFPSSRIPAITYGAVLAGAAVAYYVLQLQIIAHQGPHSKLRAAVGRDLKGKGSVVLYLVALPLCFVHAAISIAVYWLVALIWLVPDRRIESRLHQATAKADGKS
jgi:uncharacterized membrane protein